VTRVADARTRLLLITLIRIGLGLAMLFATFVGDARPRSLGLAFLVGAIFVAFAALADRRALLLSGQEEPEPLPDGFARDPHWRVALMAAFPSTVGLAVLSAVALVTGNEVLGALLAGGIAGLGIASLIGLGAVLAWERERDARLYFGPHGSRFLARD
jgi:hypothetical protein